MVIVEHSTETLAPMYRLRWHDDWGGTQELVCEALMIARGVVVRHEVDDRVLKRCLPEEDHSVQTPTHLWGRRVRCAIDKHNANTRVPEGKIPETASAYSFRHSRISEMLQVHEIDPITVAQQTGTSVAMIEQTYFKFIQSAMRAKLASIKDGRAAGP